MKAELLGVDPAMLARHTAVSAEVADAMAAGARARTGADYALSVTGYADGEQAGLVYLGFADAQGSEARRVQLFGDRARVRSLAVILALDWLRRKAA